MYVPSDHSSQMWEGRSTTAAAQKTAKGFVKPLKEKFYQDIFKICGAEMHEGIKAFRHKNLISVPDVRYIKFEKETNTRSGQKHFFCRKSHSKSKYN